MTTRRFNTNPIHIDSLLQDIQRGELALPEFQRDFVWSPGESASLLTSIVQGYRAGSLLLWSPGQAEVAARAFAGANDLYTANPRLALDGQQRLTSLYQAFYGVGDSRYFVNLKALLADEPDIDEVVVWMTANDIMVRGLDQDRRQFQELLFPLERLRVGMQGFSTWCYERQKHPMNSGTDANGRELDFRLTTIGNDWIRALVDYQFPVIEMTKDASIDAVCHIFEKVNSTGQSLTMFELLTARFWVKGVNLRQQWDEALSVRGGILKTFSIDPIDVLRVIALLADVPNPARPAAVFKLSAIHIDRHWNDAVRGMAMALELLRDEFGVVDVQWLPYAPMVTPLAAIEAGRPATAESERGSRLQRLHRWYWCSVFSGAYVQGAATRTVADYHALKRWLDDPINAVEPEAVRHFAGFWPGRLRELTRKGQAEFKACVGILLRRKPRDLANGRPLNGPNLSPKQLQRRFIFPKRQYGAQIPRALLDCILNTTFTHTKIAGYAARQQPSSYLQESHRVLGARLPDVLAEHLLPINENSALWSDQFESFLEERTRLFATEISKLTGVPCRADTAVEEPSERLVQASELMSGVKT